MAIIGEFGTAPEYKAKGYSSKGVVVHGTDEEVLKVFRFSDVVLVRGGYFADSDTEQEFYVLFADEDEDDE